MRKTLLILNDPPYGTERSYNGLRLAGVLAKRDGAEVRVFLMGDAAACAKCGQSVPQGYYNIESMLKLVIGRGGSVVVCATCMDARGFADSDLVQGCARSSLEQLTEWTQWADHVVTF